MWIESAVIGLISTNDLVPAIALVLVESASIALAQIESTSRLLVWIESASIHWAITIVEVVSICLFDVVEFSKRTQNFALVCKNRTDE